MSCGLAVAWVACRFGGCLGHRALLLVGPDYADARDGFGFGYVVDRPWGPATPGGSKSGFEVHKPGRIHLSRAPKDRLLLRDAHEFFAGLDAGGKRPGETGRKAYPDQISRARSPQLGIKSVHSDGQVITRTDVEEVRAMRGRADN